MAPRWVRRAHHLPALSHVTCVRIAAEQVAHHLRRVRLADLLHSVVITETVKPTESSVVDRTAPIVTANSRKSPSAAREIVVRVITRSLAYCRKNHAVERHELVEAVAVSGGSAAAREAGARGRGIRC